MFSVRTVDRRHAVRTEALGTKPKFWFADDDKRLLFKAEHRGTGEDWAEVVASRLCDEIGLPHVDYELAVASAEQTELERGVVCEDMAPPGGALILGNELLLAVDPSYPPTQRFKVRQHTIDAIVDVLAVLEPPAANWMLDAPSGVETALDVFVGYVMLDAWIANQDRHHENWGAVVKDVRPYLAPSFDHGAAMARNLTDRERKDRLSTRHEARSVGAFVKRARSAFYADATARRPLGTLEAFLAFAEQAPRARRAWLDRMASVRTETVCGIVEQVPHDRMTSLAREFTMKLLTLNHQRLQEKDP